VFTNWCRLFIGPGQGMLCPRGRVTNAATSVHGGGLLADDGHTGAVEGEVQAPAGGGRAHLIGVAGGGRVQRQVRAEGQGPLVGAGQRVYGDDRRGADQALSR
jgi:hypothetical protein